MSIIDYKQEAKDEEEQIMAKQSISQKNKKALQRFLNRYDVSDARKWIFLSNIRVLLEASEDIEADMHNRDKINQIFRKFREKMKPSVYATKINVSNAFVRWLNNGDKPEGFKDIKSISKSKQKRDLKPEDMITWEDGKNAIAMTNSIQIKAMVLTQLDGGMRPSEFIDLNFGDAKIMKDLIVLNIRQGKTGARNVFLHRAAPMLQRWLQNHPTKKAADPLWILEYESKSRLKEEGLKRYTYAAIKKRIDTLFKKAGIDKPHDLYNFRHSSCVLDKLDNLPLELAADRHGHSVKFFTDTYGRLSAEDVAGRYRTHYGEVEEKRTLEKNIVCERCGSVNELEREYCQQCGSPLSLKKALEMVDMPTKILSQLADLPTLKQALKLVIEAQKAKEK